MDQDDTWHGCGPQSRPHCVRCGPSSPPQKGHSPHFSAYVCCGQTAGWIKMPLGMEVGLCPGDIVLVLDGDPAPPKKLQSTPSFRPCLLWPNDGQSQLLLSTCTFYFIQTLVLTFLFIVKVSPGAVWPPPLSLVHCCNPNPNPVTLTLTI